MAPTELTPELSQLFQSIETRFKDTHLGDERWYLLVIACLSASPDPESAAALYQYLTRQEVYQTSGSRQALVRRLREALIKTTILVGVCKPLEAILSIMKVEKPEDRDFSQTRDGWQADQANHDRGIDWFKKVYTRNAGDTMGLFDAHKDFAWVSAEITYGLFLSDRQVLDDTDTQLVVLPVIMSQNLPLETHWHIRGTRRIGVSKEDVQAIWDSVKEVSKFFGVELHKVPTVDEVEPDV
ncbi:DNA polymerase alpha subunit B [Fusarium oxysporum NRRL 32931]|uniref:DNA polymerase alpha subunit B n=2 Tax=Fusarium oxysporum TaxID=5507 RepID=W9HUY5_FUSOX|nr:DNA polymerase alpha subunit B [Fusarium oxysporum NRRL 32931]EWY84002.1 DNA polymerase alpha subunit B [Fusarium oxysporum NRRL 32931]